MRPSPPESSCARLLKFRRVHRRERRKNRESGIDFSGSPESSVGWIASPEAMSACCVSPKDRAVISIAIPGIYSLKPRLCESGSEDLRAGCIRPQKEVSVQAQKKGGVLASTHRWKRRRHAEDGSLASLKTGPKNKRRQRRSRSRGLIDRDICRGTPATTANVDSRLANRRSDHAGSRIDFVDAREPVVCRRMAWLLRIYRRINM